MKQQSNLTPKILIVAACAALSLAPVALAEKVTSQAPDPDDPTQLLRGPSVEDRDVPGVTEMFGEPPRPGAQQQGQRREQPIRFQVFMKAMRALGDEDTPERLRPTPEQVEEVRAIARDFGKEMRAFQKADKDEIKSLRERAGRTRDGKAQQRDRARERQGGDSSRDRERQDRSDQARGSFAPDDGNAPRREARAKPGPESRKDRELAQQQLRDLWASAPRPDAHYERIWDVLTAEQRAFVEGQLAAHRDEMMMRRAENEAERILERTRRASPEQRRRFAQREGRRQRDRRNDAPPPPPPAVDDLDVPDRP